MVAILLLSIFAYVVIALLMMAMTIHGPDAEPLALIFLIVSSGVAVGILPAFRRSPRRAMALLYFLFCFAVGLTGPLTMFVYSLLAC